MLVLNVASVIVNMGMFAIVRVRILDRIENLNETDFITIEGHDCHPDAIECCGDCLELNGYDVIEE